MTPMKRGVRRKVWAAVNKETGELFMDRIWDTREDAIYDACTDTKIWRATRLTIHYTLPAKREQRKAK